VTLNNLREFEIERNKDTITLTFERDSEDNLLGKTVAELNQQGATILNVETEKATLLDVLESYEES